LRQASNLYIVRTEESKSRTG